MHYNYGLAIEIKEIVKSNQYFKLLFIFQEDYEETSEKMNRGLGGQFYFGLFAFQN